MGVAPAYMGVMMIVLTIAVLLLSLLGLQARRLSFAAPGTAMPGARSLGPLMMAAVARDASPPSPARGAASHAMITDIEDYFAKGCGRCARFATPQCSARKWQAGLAALRSLCLEAGLSETVKWGHPCYMLGARNIALIGALQGDFTLSFFNAALLKDPERRLQKPGPNTQHASVIRFASDAEVAALRPTLLAYLKEAMGYAAAGLLPPKQARDIALPEELVDALDADPELAEAFHRLTPGRQRSYVIALSSAKTSTTRVARIAKFRDKVITGKGANER